MSLRIAIKRSLELEEDLSHHNNMDGNSKIIFSSPKKNDDFLPPTILPCSSSSNGNSTVPIVQLPRIEHCIHNHDPMKIHEFGFVEVSGILSENLINEVRQEAMNTIICSSSSSSRNSPTNPMKGKRGRPPKNKKMQVISNALQVDVSSGLRDKINLEVQASVIAKDIMKTVFGERGIGGTESNYHSFILETPKFLITMPGSHPQIPHADDHCNSCIMGLIHLLDNQEPTHVSTYHGLQKDFPTGITVSCNRCNRTQMLPDRDYRRGVHLTDEEWNCHDCDAPCPPYNFEESIVKSFGELLEAGAPRLCHSYCGKATSEDVHAGDGILSLPTLIHRGPGCASTAIENRYMLFFTLRPQYRNLVVRSEKEYFHTYNPDLQIHAPSILFNQFTNVKSIYDRSGCNLEGYLSTIVGEEMSSLMKEVALLRAENKCLKKKRECFRHKNEYFFDETTTKVD